MATGTSRLTSKQEAFCSAYLTLGSGAAAYRAAYDAERMQSASIYVAASRLLNNAKIAHRVDALQQRSAPVCGVTVAAITADLRRAHDLAIARMNAAAAVTASMGLAKLHGLLARRMAVLADRGTDDNCPGSLRARCRPSPGETHPAGERSVDDAE